MLRLTHFNYRKVVTTPCGPGLEDSIGSIRNRLLLQDRLANALSQVPNRSTGARTLGSGPAQRFTESFRRKEMKRISLKIRLLFVVAGMLLAVIAPSRLLAQAQTAGIVGVVADASGGVVPNAKVTVTSPALQVPELTTMTDAQGNYKFVELPAPGVYRIKFEAKG